jgi:hypothetical protein
VRNLRTQIALPRSITSCAAPAATGPTLSVQANH